MHSLRLLYDPLSAIAMKWIQKQPCDESEVKLISSGFKLYLKLNAIANVIMTFH